jgi:hypothetical protein
LTDGHNTDPVQGGIRAEILDLIDQKTRTARAEWQRAKDLQAVVPVEQALLFLKAMLAAAQEVVTDSEQFRLLNARLLAFLPPPDP